MGSLFGDGGPTPPRKKVPVHEKDGTLSHDAQQFIHWWNEQLSSKCGKIPFCKGISQGGRRARMLRARLNDGDFRELFATEAAAKTFAQRIVYNRFLRGDSKPRDGTRNPFVVRLDWFLQGDNWRKIAEGYYDGSLDPLPSDDGPNVRRNRPRSR